LNTERNQQLLLVKNIQNNIDFSHFKLRTLQRVLASPLGNLEYH
jgi:hypothetical protein